MTLSTLDLGTTQTLPSGLIVPVSVRGAIEYSRDPKQEWLDELARFNAQVPQDAPRLHIYWHAGYESINEIGLRTWHPIERWVFYQVAQYVKDVPTFLLSDTQQVLREVGKLDDHARPELNESMLDSNQIRLYRAHRVYAKPYWIVQGQHGGHKRHFDEVESMVSEMHGGSESPPGYGELPYAEPNALTWNALRELDSLSDAKAAALVLFVNPNALDAQDRAEAEGKQAALWAYIERMSAGIVDSLSWMDRAALKHAAPIGLSTKARTPGFAQDLDDAQELFFADEH